MFGVEPLGPDPRNRPRTARGSAGLLHGARTLLLQNEDGQIEASGSIAPGLDYPAVGPEHAALHDRGRVRYVGATDQETVAAVHAMCETEGILPALESAHAVAFALRAVQDGELGAGARVVINVSGRGDKDLAILQAQTTAADGEVTS